MDRFTDAYTDLEEYIRLSEPDGRRMGRIWQTAIGLQAFFRNLLLREQNELKNRFLRLRAKAMQSQDETVNETVNETINSDDETINVERETINEGQQLVLRALADNPGATYGQLVEVTGLSRASIARAISSLKACGLIEREGSKKTGSWVVR